MKESILTYLVHWANKHFSTSLIRAWEPESHPPCWMVFLGGDHHTCPPMLRWPSETGWGGKLEGSHCLRQEWGGVPQLAGPGLLKDDAKECFSKPSSKSNFWYICGSLLENRLQPAGFRENSSNRSPGQALSPQHTWPGQAGTVPFFLRWYLWTLWIRELRLKSLLQTYHI